MAINIADIRKKIASGAIKPSTGGANFGPKVGEGVFLCKIDAAAYGQGESGNNRGVFDLTVIDAENQAEIGGKIKRYSQTIRPEFAEQELALLSTLMQKLPGGAARAEKIFEDASTHADLIQNAFTQYSKLITELAREQKIVKVVLKRKQQAKLDDRGKPRFYNDILLNETLELYSDAEQVAPAASEPEAPEAQSASEQQPAAQPARKKAWA